MITIPNGFLLEVAESARKMSIADETPVFLIQEIDEGDIRVEIKPHSLHSCGCHSQFGIYCVPSLVSGNLRARFRT